MEPRAKRPDRGRSNPTLSNGTAARLLAGRLTELSIQPGGLPPHVAAHLRAIVEGEAAAVQDDLAEKVARLEAQAEAERRRLTAKRITLAVVGKAFRLPAPAAAETAAPPHLLIGEVA